MYVCLRHPLLQNHDRYRQCIGRRIRETGAIQETAQLADDLSHGNRQLKLHCTSLGVLD